MRSTVLVLGSIAFDYIMQFKDRFVDHLVQQDQFNFQMALVVDSYEVKYGGTAGNICYSLGLLKKPSIMVSSVGKDFYQTDYPMILKQKYTDCRVDIYENDFSARCYIVSDINKNQIITFYAGALRNAYKINLYRKISQFDNIKIAINAPNPINAMISFHNQLNQIGIPEIFDPGQQIGQFSKEELQNLLNSVEFVIVNEHEFKLLQRKTNMDKNKLCSIVPKLIITLGENGSILYDHGEKCEISVAKPEKVVDPTGAGDGYRSGLISGILDNLDLYECCKLGAVVGSYIVETSGGQEHVFSENEFIQRYEQYFGNFPKGFKLIRK
ncbi:MAG: carbohydrate kinase family protein [Candidatus Helarchaeota archaeon]